METVSVLLLEDHEGEARLNQRLLERSHTTEFHFSGARTLDEAVTILQEQSFDVLLLDLNLPDSRGIETFDRIHAIAPSLPVVIISAVADDALAVRCIRHGAQDYLVKGNITSEIMTRVVRYAMARSRQVAVRSPLSSDRPIPPGASFLVDGDGLIHNSEQLDMLLESVSTQSRSLFNVVTEEQRSMVESMHARVLNQGLAETMLVTLRQGEDTHAGSMLLMLAPFEGELPGMLVGGFLPTHPSLQMDEHPDEKYRALVEHSQDGVFIVMEGNIVFANQMLADISGYAHDEMLHTPIERFVAPEDRNNVLEHYRGRLAGEEMPEAYEFTLLQKSGARRKVQINVGRIPLGDRMAVMGTLKDISEKRRNAYFMQVQHQLAVDLAYAADMEVMFEHIVRALLRIESIDAAGLYLREGKAGVYTLVHSRGVQDPITKLQENEEFTSVHAQIVRESVTRYFDDTSLSTLPAAGVLRDQGVRCMGILPITHGGKVVAAVDIVSLTYEDFVTDVRRTAQSIASYVGGVLSRLSTEEALRDSELLYRAVVEKSHDAIFIHQDDRLMFANERTCELTGYRREELAEMNAWSLIHPEDRKRIQEISAARREDISGPIVYEGRVLTRNGTIRAGEFAATIIRYEGKPAALVTVRDVTSRKSHEEEVRRSDTLLRSAGFAAARFLQSAAWEDSILEVLGHFGDAANVCRVLLMQNREDENGVTRRYQRNVWVRREMQDSVLDRIPDGQSWEEMPYARWAEELAQGRSIASVVDDLPQEEQMTLARQNVRSTAMVPVFSGGTWWGFLRFDECRLRRSWLRSEIDAMLVCAQTLGAAVHRQQAEEELIAEKERAERADEIKQAFIANMSHEVRTPLNIILGYLALVMELSNDESDEDTRDFLRAIEDASQRLIRTVDSIMNISRFQASDISLQKQSIRLDKLVGSCLDRFENAVREKGLQLEFHNHCSDSEILADQHYLAESIDHLIDNAVKFTPIGSVQLLLEDGETGGPRLVVRDTGIGISEDFLERMYDPYVQEDIGFDRSYEGVGLGLTLVKLYLEAHGAQITVESEKGKGSTFTVDFPSARKPEESETRSTYSA
ncbi:PAS domain S-box protein [bacterium]|nr:PAS domain S-box protein [bacterium]